MAGRIVTWPWTRQPQGAVEIADKWRPFVAALTVGTRFFDGANWGALPLTAQQTLSVGRAGLTLQTVGDSVPISFQVARPPSFSEWAYVIVGRRSQDTAFDAAASFNESDSAYIEISTGSNSSFSPTVSGLFNHCAVGVFDGTPSIGAQVGFYSRARNFGGIFVDGTLVASGTHAFAGAALVRHFAVGGRYLQSGRNWRGGTELIALLSSPPFELCAELSSNPWQLFAPRRILVPVGAAPPAGIDASITETVSASDSSSAILIRAGSVVEVVSAADAQAAVAVLIASLSEAAAATETQAAALIRQAAITEAASAADSATGDIASGINASITETVSASDSAAALGVLVADISEPASAADAASAAMVAVATITEPVSAADSVQGEIGGNVVTAAATETIAAADTQTAIGVRVAAAAETLTLTDAAATQAVLVAQVVETIVLLDSAIGIRDGETVPLPTYIARLPRERRIAVLPAEQRIARLPRERRIWSKAS